MVGLEDWRIGGLEDYTILRNEPVNSGVMALLCLCPEGAQEYSPGPGAKATPPRVKIPQSESALKGRESFWG